ncbi:hypothetical protein ILUMI_20859 [Ignelater luminosus]|uniref:Uncharacterized protein n=1 Tax=Ignelater luminosus TaxID=2038154 RepID=A0A8K0G1Y9_IGNLU|nr:hypothetical protein ILUMI_20859 [Ignelater luminosus]
MCLEKTQYKDKIKAMFNLAPIAFLKHMISPLLPVVAEFRTGILALYNVLNTYEFLPRNEFLAQLGDTSCNNNATFQILCTNALFAICDFNEKQMNSSLLPIIMGYTPSGASTKQIYHCVPGVKSGKFQRWDYGWVSNLDYYGDTSPPNYNLRNIYEPVYLFYSKKWQ